MKGGINVSKKDAKDFIYLIWKEPNTRRNYIVGQLSKNGHYEFAYGHEVEKAIKVGFELMISFDDINEVYKSDTLFPTFSSRLPDKKRRGIEKILLKYGLQEYDEYKLLKRSGARLPIDNLEFIDPILEEEFNGIRVFHIAGVRHYFGCESGDCSNALHLEVGDELKLELFPENRYDSNAIKINDKKGNHIGYLPRYYSENMTKLLKRGSGYKCTVLEVNKEKNCHECIKVRLELNSDSGKVKKIS